MIIHTIVRPQKESNSWHRRGNDAEDAEIIGHEYGHAI